MPLITSNIPNMINGVSQQPPALRLASQAESQVNYLSSVSDGLVDRPPTRNLAKISNNVWNAAYFHTINRDLNERYVVALEAGVLKVFEAETGVERTVNVTDPAYLTAGSPTREDWRMVTVADYTFVLNTKVNTALLPDLVPARREEYVIRVNGGNYGRKYQIFVNGGLAAEFQTPDGDQPAHADQVDTDYIAWQLQTKFQAGAYNGSYTINRESNVLRIHHNSWAAFSVRVQDGANGANMTGIGPTVQRFSELPSKAWLGFRTEIIGDNTSGFDNYYVEYTHDSPSGQNSPEGGYWKETMKGGEQYRLDPATMPHVLVREANGTFTFRKATWSERKSGDLDKMEISFVGNSLRDIFFFQNRLGFASDEQIIMSQDGEYFDFWRDTATQLLDTDPIDIGIATAQVSIVNWAVPFQRALLLFTDQAQFTLSAGDFLTPQSVSVGASTSFESTRNVRPVGVGPFVYFPVPRGGHTGLREYFVQENNTGNDARDVTSHVPRYIPKDVFSMSASSAEETLVLLSRETPNVAWIYRYYNSNEGKLQSAWSCWKFDDDATLRAAEFIESSLYFVISRPDGTYLEVMDLESGATSFGSSLRFNADRQTNVTGMSYDAGTGLTTFTAPYAVSNDDLMVIVRGDDGTYPEGTLVPLTKVNNTTYTARGDWTARKLLFGVRYMREYKFSTFFVREDAQGGGVSADNAGRLQIRRLFIDYDRSAYFKVRIEGRGRPVRETVFSGRTLGAESGTLGTYNRATGRVSVGVQGRNTDVVISITTDSHLPSGFTSAEWEAQHTLRARKV